MINLIRYFDMFAGVGGFRAGLTKAGGFQCIGHCEIDKYANLSYEAAHNPKKSEVYYPDATKIDETTMPDFDLLCAGFPCQSFSVAGKRKGFDDTRGTMFFEIARILRHKKPPYVLLENVPGLLSHDKGKTFAVIIGTLCQLGYCVEWMVYNSKNFRVPQSRRRVFLIGYLDPRCAGKILSVGTANPKNIIQLVSGPQGSRIYDADGIACTQTAGAGGQGGKTGLYFIDLCKTGAVVTDHARCLTARQDNGITNFRGQTSGVLETSCAVLTPDREKVRQQGQSIKNPEEPMFTLTNQDKHGVLLIKEATKRGYKEASDGDTVDLAFTGSNTRRGRVGRDIAHTLDTGSTQGVVRSGRIRRLMPRECFRLQGFPEDMIDRILAITSDAQAYKQAGNSVTVNVIEAIGRRIRAVHEELKVGEINE